MSKYKLPDSLNFEDYSNIWKNKGYFFEDTADSKPQFVEVSDALSHTQSTEYFPIFVEKYIREAIEPATIFTNLLERVQYTPGLSMTFGSTGAIYADDVNELGEYPEFSIEFGKGPQVITIGKSGLALKFSEEWKRYNNYDLFLMYLRKMADAMSRLKEGKAFATFSEMGTVTHDNLNPSGSIFGTTSGYSYTGSANGSVSAEDIIEAYGQILAQGFVVDTLVVHPMTFTMFMIDPVLRAFALASGNMNNWFNWYKGSAANGSPFSNGVLGKMGGLATPASEKGKAEYNFSAKTSVPDYLGLNLKILVSPYVPYNETTKVTDIYLIDSKNIGALVVDEEVKMDEIVDKLRDFTKIKMRERYSIVPFFDGLAVGVMKNIKITPNRIIAPVQPTIDGFTPHNRSIALTF